MAAALDFQKFAEELHWCIGQLELGLQRQSPDSRQAAETIKLLKILRSNKAPMVKKRQVMRNAFGDYRKKMKEAEKKSLSGLRHSRFQPLGSTKTPINSRFLKLSHSKQSAGLAGDALDRNLGNLNLESSACELTISQTSSEGASSSAGEWNHQVPCVSAGLSMYSNGTVLGNDAELGFIQSNQALPKGLLDATATSRSSPASRSASASVGSHQTVPTHVSTSHTGFKYEPSDSLFVFGFDSPEDEDSPEIVAARNAASGSGTVSHFSEEGCNKTADSLYKYEKSENNFCFNFTTPGDES